MVGVECSKCGATREVEAAKLEDWFPKPGEAALCQKCQEANAPEAAIDAKPLTREELVEANKELRERIQAAEDRVLEFEATGKASNDLLRNLFAAIDKTQIDNPNLSLAQCVGGLGIIAFAKMADSLLEDGLLEPVIQETAPESE